MRSDPWFRFTFRLAAHMRTSRRQLLETIDGSELQAWQLYDQVIGLPDSYWETGLICATIVNVMGNPDRPCRPEDFIPRIYDEPQEPDDATLTQRAELDLIRFRALTKQRNETRG